MSRSFIVRQALYAWRLSLPRRSLVATCCAHLASSPSNGVPVVPQSPPPPAAAHKPLPSDCKGPVQRRLPCKRPFAGIAVSSVVERRRARPLLHSLLLRPRPLPANLTHCTNPPRTEQCGPPTLPVSSESCICKLDINQRPHGVSPAAWTGSASRTCASPVRFPQALGAGLSRQLLTGCSHRCRWPLQA